MTDALSGHHGPAPEALVLALHQLVRGPLDAALIPHTEALCRRYLGGAARDGRWPFRIVRGKERFPASVALLSPERGTWTNETTGRQGGLLDLIRLAGSHETLSATMMAARDFLEAEHQREAEAQRRLTAALARHAEAFCRRYLPHGAKQDNQWRVPHVAVDKAPYSMTVELLSPEQGAWRLEATSGQGALRDIVQSAREGIRTARALIKGETLERPMHVHLLGPGKAMWQDRLAGKPGDLFDLICHAAGYGDKARGMAAGSDFLEGEREARRALAAELAPHAEALCRRFLPESVEVVRLPDVLTVRGQKESLTVRLSGPERGTWKDEVTGRQGDLLDLIRIEGKHHNDLAATMAAGSAFLESRAGSPPSARRRALALRRGLLQALPFEERQDGPPAGCAHCPGPKGILDHPPLRPRTGHLDERDNGPPGRPPRPHPHQGQTRERPRRRDGRGKRLPRSRAGSPPSTQCRARAPHRGPL